MIEIRNINLLFDDLWPLMPYAIEHKQNCLSSINTIQTVFKRHSTDHNALLNQLNLIDGIGLTIASGLIWSVYPNKRVPFDKFTLTYVKEVSVRFLSK